MTFRALDWVDLRLSGTDSVKSPAGLGYTGVRVSRDDILARWKKGKLFDDEARALIRAEMDKNAAFIGQEKGAGIVLKKFPCFGKKRAMAFVREMTGNDKPGPKGPRGKSCD